MLQLDARARCLQRALEGVVGIRPDAAGFRDLQAEEPGTGPEASAGRTWCIRVILAHSQFEWPIPDLVVQPPLVLTSPAARRNA